MEKIQIERKSTRVDVEGVRAVISDGRTSYCGLVANISQFGLCVKDIPESLSTKKSFLSIMIQGECDNIRIVARPKWEKPQENLGKTIGAEVASSPDGWQNFILAH